MLVYNNLSRVHHIHWKKSKNIHISDDRDRVDNVWLESQQRLVRLNREQNGDKPLTPKHKSPKEYNHTSQCS